MSSPPSPPPTPAGFTPVGSQAGGAKRPINPFLASDPHQRAKRLARALVSDIVAYNPQKREEGLRGGTLRELFQEEIRKSRQEYTDQVGHEFAANTNHFNDALNEILAGGRHVF